MSSEPRLWTFRLRHIIEAAEECLAFVEGMSYDDLAADRRTFNAVVWSLTVIGEAAKHIPEQTCAAYPDIPWAQMRGLRNQIVHVYDKIDTEILWQVLQDELPPLRPCCDKCWLRWRTQNEPHRKRPRTTNPRLVRRTWLPRSARL